MKVYKKRMFSSNNFEPYYLENPNKKQGGGDKYAFLFFVFLVLVVFGILIFFNLNDFPSFSEIKRCSILWKRSELHDNFVILAELFKEHHIISSSKDLSRFFAEGSKLRYRELEKFLESNDFLILGETVHEFIQRYDFNNCNSVLREYLMNNQWLSESDNVKDFLRMYLKDRRFDFFLKVCYKYGIFSNYAVLVGVFPIVELLYLCGKLLLCSICIVSILILLFFVLMDKTFYKY